MKKLYAVHLVGGDKRIPKFIKKMAYLELWTTAEKRRQLEQARMRLYCFWPKKADFENLREVIKQGLAEGSLSYSDSPRIRAKVITDLLGYEYSGFAGLVTTIAVILEEEEV